VVDNKVVAEIAGSEFITDKNGERHKLASDIPPHEGEFLWRIIRENKFKHTIEIGCGFGISSLYICDAISAQPGSHHVIVDPYQSTQWHGIGVHNLNRAGFSSYRLIEKPSEIALPALLESGERFDFAFIDGWHTFEHVLLDFFYLNRLLKVGGIIVFHDIYSHALNRVLRYIVNYPNYRVAEVMGRVTLKRRLLNAVKVLAHFFVRLIPRSLSEELFDATLIRPGLFLKLYGNMVVLQKTAEDSRDWGWYKHF
jgi:predicted O-methyltransferase YrrM